MEPLRHLRPLPSTTAGLLLRSTFDRLPYGCLLFMYRLDLTFTLGPYCWRVGAITSLIKGRLPGASWQAQTVWGNGKACFLSVYETRSGSELLVKSQVTFSPRFRSTFDLGFHPCGCLLMSVVYMYVLSDLT